jgi:hypothetical protein
LEENGSNDADEYYRRTPVGGADHNSMDYACSATLGNRVGKEADFGRIAAYPTKVPTVLPRVPSVISI